MPAYNELDAIEHSVGDVVRHILDRVDASELIVVDDGSTDGSGRLLDQIASTDSRIHVLHQANGGHGPALYAGLQSARGEWLMLVDADRQIPLSAFNDLWRSAEGRDAAFGVRVKRHDPRHRLILTRVVAALVRLLTGVTLRDANVPFKLVRSEAWRAARAVIPAATLTPSLFLAIFLKRGPYRVVEVPIPHQERPTGHSSLRALKLARFCLRAFAQMVVFRLRLVRGSSV